MPGLSQTSVSRKVLVVGAYDDPRGDDELLLATATGDGGAFAAFYGRHVAEVLAFLARKAPAGRPAANGDPPGSLNQPRLTPTAHRPPPPRRLHQPAPPERNRAAWRPPARHRSVRARAGGARASAARPSAKPSACAAARGSPASARHSRTAAREPRVPP